MEQGVTPARLGRLLVGGRSIEVQARGKGPAVLLVHGWQSNSHKMGVLADAVVEAGFSAVTWDMPAHGSSPGWTSSLPLFVEAIEKVAAMVGGPHAVVAHSLGATAAVMALKRGVRVQSLVLLAPMISFDFALDQFQQILGLSSVLRELTACHTESRVSLKRSDADLLQMSAPSAALQIIHDEEDQRTPYAYTRRLIENWPESELLTTQGLGHNRLLSDLRVKGEVSAFLARNPHPETFPWSSYFALAPELVV